MQSSLAQEAETLRHELVHFEQDLATGLDNNTQTLISGESVVQKIWDDSSLHPELKAHIIEHYQPKQYLIELEAYLLQDYPLGYVLTYEVSKWLLSYSYQLTLPVLGTLPVC